MKTSVLLALFAASVFAFPATASAQWAPSPTVIIVNPAPPAYGNFGAWRPGVAAAAWGGGCGAGWGGAGCGAGWGGGGWGGGSCYVLVLTPWGWQCAQ
jgi:hypothetical protein